MVMLVWAGEWGDTSTPDITLLVVVISLIVVIGANTAIMASRNDSYRWWYGLIKVAFYLGSFALTLSTGGATAAIASISTFLGMELNKLAQLMHVYGLLPQLANGRRARKENKEGQDTARR
jgi:bacteriorhodopsin